MRRVGSRAVSLVRALNGARLDCAASPLPAALPSSLPPRRPFSQQQQRKEEGGDVERPSKNVVQRLADSVMAELRKDKQLKVASSFLVLFPLKCLSPAQEQMERLRKERESLENTDALKAAREKYVSTRFRFESPD